MPAYDAGSATVRVRPDASGFIRDLRVDLARHTDPGFTVKVDADTRPAIAEIQRLRTAVNASAVSIRVEVDTALARTEIQRFREWASQNVDIGVGLNMVTMNARLAEWRRVEESDAIVIPVDVDTTRAMMGMLAFRQFQESNSFNVHADVVTTTASSEMARWRREQEANALNIRVNANTRGGNGGRGGRGGMMGLAAITGLSQIPMAALGVANLAAALQQLSQVGLVVPGVMAGVISSVGTLALGLNGIKDAYDAVSTASETAGVDQAAQARQAAQATTQLRNAVVDEAQAQKDVSRARRDARQQLADLNIELRGGKISEARALLELQRAQQDLASGDYTDQADAVLRVAETEQNLLEVRARNADLAQQTAEANAAGVEGSDEVVAANERLVRSGQQVADAQAAVADATSATSTNAAAATEALDKLSPAAREFVETLIGNKGAFSELRTGVQETMFNGLAGDLQGTLTSLMPVLDTGLTEIADGWNSTFEELFTSVGSGRSTGLLDRILGNTGEAQTRFADAVDPIVDSILTLAGAGSDSLPRIADAIGDVATRFSTFLSEADADGRLAEWIDEGLDGLTNLGNTVLNIGSAFDGITSAVEGNFLDALEVGSGKLADFLNSTEGQNALREFFDHGADMFNAWKPILEALPGIFMGAMEGSGAAVQTLLTVLSPLTTLLSEYPEMVGAVAAAFTAVLVGSAVRAAITSLVTMIGTVTASLAASTGVMGAISAIATGPLGLAAIGVAAAAAFLIFRDEVDETIERTKRLEQAQKDLMETLDQVTGRINEQTRGEMVENLRDFSMASDPTFTGPGGSRDVMAAGQALGLDPYQLTSAALGDTAASSAIRDVLLNNNLRPEFAENGKLSELLTVLAGQDISPETVYSALLGDMAANQQVNEALATDSAAESIQSRLGMTVATTGDIAKMLSDTGRYSVMVGNAINEQAGLLPGAQSQTQADNIATYGPRELTSYGEEVFGPGAMVQYNGAQYEVTTDNLSGPMAETLRARGHTVQPPVPPDTTWQITLANDRVGDLVKPYSKGGPTPSGRGPGPTGGFFSELHDDEFVISKRGRARVPDSFLYALNRGDIDPSVLAGLAIPGFEVGGDPRDDDPKNAHNPGGALSSPGLGPLPGPVQPVAPNTRPGGILGAVNTAVNGLQTPLTNLTSAAPTSGKPTPQNPFAWLPQPGQDMSTWNPFAGAPEKLQPQNIAAQFGSALMTGVLSFFGLENSILSPNNTYRQALDKALGFFGGTNQNTGTGLDLPSSLQIPGAPTGMLVTDDMLDQLYSNPNALSNLTAALAPDPTNTDYIGAMTSVAESLGVPLYSGMRPDETGSYHSTGTAADFSNGSGNTPEQLALANYIADNYAAYTTELIYDDPNFNRNINNGQFVGKFGEFYTLDQAGPHHHHVHWAVSQAPAMMANDPNLQSLLGNSTASPAAYDPEGGAEQWRPVVNQALATLGPQLGITNYSAYAEDILGQIQFESHGDPSALNPQDSDGLPAIGLGQFKEGTFASNNVLGGDINDPVAQIYAMIKYTAGRYGVVPDGGVDWTSVPYEAGWRLGKGYYAGGPTPSGRGDGPTGGFIAEVHDDEFIISKLGRSKVPDSFLHALNEGRVPGFVAGGDPSRGVVPRPPAPPRPPDAQRIVPPAPRPPSVPGPTPAAPTTPTVPTAPTPAPTAPSVPSVPPPQQKPVTAPTPTAAASGAGSWDHNLGWIDTAIDSGAATLGNIAGTAASMGMTAGGGAGGGMAGSMISGLFSQGGKVAKDLVNVVSSSLVGSVPGSMGEPGAPAYGTTLRPDQNRPSTAEYRPFQPAPTYNISGWDFPMVRRELEAKESLDMQARLSHRP